MYSIFYIYMYTHTLLQYLEIPGVYGLGFKTESRNQVRHRKSVVTYPSCSYRLFTLLKDSRDYVRGGGTPPGPGGTVGISIACPG